jgi:hypothetical protein
MILAALKLVAENGVLSSRNGKPGHMLPPATAEMVRGFLISEEVSRILPGTKGYISFNSKGKKDVLQK